MVIITVKEYLKESIEESELNITREAATSVTKELFDVSEKATKLVGHRAERFHSVV